LPARQGLVLGLTTATITWLWVAAVDTISGQPFHTFGVLGGITAFRLVHYMLNIVYAFAAVGVARGAAKTPSVVIGAIFVFIILEIAFAMLSTILSETAVGNRS
jgi:hypothetical protein